MNKRSTINRYTLLEETEQIEERIKGTDFISNFFNYVDKYNKYNPNPYLIGNIEIIQTKGIILYTKYKKLADPSTLEKIDNLTRMYKEEEIKALYQEKTTGNKPLFIGYKANRKVRTLEIIYKENKKYIDRNYIKEHVRKYASDLNFLGLIINNEQIKKSVHSSDEEFTLLNKLKEELLIGLSNPNTELLSSFYSAFLNEGGKFNYFNMRLIGILIKTYEETYKKEETKEDEIPGQIVIPEFNRKELKDKLENLKIELMEGTYQDRENTYKLTHKTTK